MTSRIKLALSLCILLATQAAHAERHPVPAEADLLSAQSTIKEVFGDTKPEELVPKLMKQAAEEKQGSPVRFELLRQARDAAAKIGDPSAASEICEELLAEYEAPIPDISKAALLTLSTTTKNPADHITLARYAILLADRCFQSEDFAAAKTLQQIATVSAQRCKDVVMAETVRNRGREIAAAEQENKKIQPLLTKLAEAPNDPAANLAVGSYRALTLGDWQTGLPMLAKGGNSPLKARAAAELAMAATPEAALAVADEWYPMIALLPADGKAQLSLHCTELYEKSLEGLAGLNKTRVTKRIEALQEITKLRAVGREEFVAASKAARAKDVTRTQSFGGAFSSKTDFEDIPSEGALLIGFNYSFAKWGQQDYIESIQPIYLTATGEKTGNWIGVPKGAKGTTKAKPGYCVSILKVRAGGNTHGFSMTFGRITKGAVSFTDTYESPYAGMNEGSAIEMKTEGKLPIGVFGKCVENGMVGTIGLVLAGAK